LEHLAYEGGGHVGNDGDIFPKIGEIPAMIEVGMGKEDSLNPDRTIEGRRSVLLPHTRILKIATIQSLKRREDTESKEIVKAKGDTRSEKFVKELSLDFEISTEVEKEGCSAVLICKENFVAADTIYPIVESEAHHHQYPLAIIVFLDCIS